MVRPACSKKGHGMLINKETEYAIRLISNLNEEEPKRMIDVAAREGVSVAIAYKIAGKLEREKIIGSVRGASGGYVLVKPLEEITLYDVFNAIETHKIIAKCLHPIEIEDAEEGSITHGIQKKLTSMQDNLFTEMSTLNLKEMMN